MEKIKAWHGPSGALLIDRPIPGLDIKRLRPGAAQWYGGPYLLCETVSKSTARYIAERLGLEWHEDYEWRQLV